MQRLTTEVYELLTLRWEVDDLGVGLNWIRRGEQNMHTTCVDDITAYEQLFRRLEKRTGALIQLLVSLSVLVLVSCLWHRSCIASEQQTNPPRQYTGSYCTTL